jgi:hypothetical protein
MLDSKFFFTLIGIMVAIFAMCNVSFTNNTTENFWGIPSRKVKVQKGVRTPNGTFALQNNYQAMLGNDKFIKTPSLQGVLSPRFSNVDFGANIRYNMPDSQNMASPCDPLTFGNMVQEGYSGNTKFTGGQQNVQENYCGQCQTSNGCKPGATCGIGGISPNDGSSVGTIPAPADYTSGNYQQEIEKVWSTGGGAPQDELPVGNMTTINAAGEAIQPVVYDRYIYANRHSRLRANGDMIRGDLPIVPCNNGWFNVSVTPSIDLQQGAMNVMGGISNKTAQDTAQFVFNSSGNTEDTIGGTDLASAFQNPQSAFNLNLSDVNMSNSFGEFGSGIGGQETVYATSFP